MYDKLKKYFENTSKEDIKKAWDDTEFWDHPEMAEHSDEYVLKYYKGDIVEYRKMEYYLRKNGWTDNWSPINWAEKEVLKKVTYPEKVGYDIEDAYRICKKRNG